MTITDDDLRAKAEAATPGPWLFSTYRLSFNEDSTRYHVERPGGADVADCVSEANAEYLASLDPRTVLALLDRLQRAEAALSDLAQHGLRTDLNPSMMGQMADPTHAYMWWTEYLSRADQAVRDRARQALQADS